MEAQEIVPVLPIFPRSFSLPVGWLGYSSVPQVTLPEIINLPIIIIKVWSLEKFSRSLLSAYSIIALICSPWFAVIMIRHYQMLFAIETLSFEMTFVVLIFTVQVVISLAVVAVQMFPALTAAHPIVDVERNHWYHLLHESILKIKRALNEKNRMT